MNYEEEARKLKSSGVICSNALFNVFKDDLNLTGNPPAPRSIDGMCGAYLTAKYILKEIGKEEYIDDYNKMFTEKFKSNKCLELMKKDRRCVDYVGESAKFINNLIK